MSRFMPFFLFLLVASAWADSVVPYGSGSDAILARGFSSVSGEFKNDCFENPTQSVTTVLGTGAAASGQAVKLTVEEVESNEQLARKLGMSASASFGIGGFGASAAVDYLRERHSTSSEYHLLLRVTVSQLTESLETGRLRLTDEAMSLLNRDPALFYQACGDEFFVSRQVGGEFAAVLSMRVKSSDDRRSVSSSFNAGGLAWNASFQSKVNEYSSQSERQLSLRIIRYGDDADLDVKPAELMKYAQGFNSRVAQRPWPVSLGTRSYLPVVLGDSRLRLDRMPLALSGLQGAFDDLGRAYLRALALVGDLGDVLDRPEAYEPVDRGAIERRIDAVEERLSELEQARALCVRALPGPCQAPQLAPLDERLPRRRVCADECFEQGFACNKKGKAIVRVNGVPLTESCDWLCPRLDGTCWGTGNFTQRCERGSKDGLEFDLRGCRGAPKCARSRQVCTLVD